MTEGKGGVISEEAQLTALLFLGKSTTEVEVAGTKVIMDLFATGREEDLQRRVTGLDEISRVYAYSVMAVAYALRSVGGYDFKGGNLEEKLNFVRGLQPAVFEIFRQAFLEARLRQTMKINELVKEMGKSQPTQSSGPAGEP